MFCIQMMSELITIQKEFFTETMEVSLWPAAQVALVDAVACGWENETVNSFVSTIQYVNSLMSTVGYS